MQPRNSETRFCVARVAPCVCDPNDEWVHGFTMRDGERDGMYLAARHVTGGVRWIDVAVSAGFGLGSIALRLWVDVATKLLRNRILAPNEVESHPALTLGGWLNRVEVSALPFDVEDLATRLVLGDDRLAAHLWDLPHVLSPTVMAPAVPRAPAPPIRVR